MTESRERQDLANRPSPTPVAPTGGIRNRRIRIAVALVAAAAIVMGLPTLRGGFVGGDDQQLVVKHVLVNRPSISHAVQLFRIVHRDLYQPVPLLSFAAEVAIGNALGLFEHGIIDGAWLFHADNLLFHALCAVLAWWVAFILQRSVGQFRAQSEKADALREAKFSDPPPIGRSAGWRRVFQDKRDVSIVGAATIAAMLFALHPLQIEVVAWVNGRMMLLSTAFALASVLAFHRWLRGGAWHWSVLTILFVLLSAISKIRIGVPAMLLIVALAGRQKLSRRFWIPWCLAIVVTLVFVGVNLWTTFIQDFKEHMELKGEGPRAVRTLLSLAWYVQHLIWPSGLSSWYPQPPVVQWWEGRTFQAIAVLVPIVLLFALISRRWVAGWLGPAWFLMTIADTLPVIPARHVLAADRYMYLSIIGLLWPIAVLTQAGFQWLASRCSVSAMRAARWIAGFGVSAALLAVSWHMAGFYNTMIGKTERIAELYPTTPHVWARIGWAYYKSGETAALAGRVEEAEQFYRQAVEIANREFTLSESDGYCEASQAIGTAQLALGRADEAVAWFRKAMEYDPESGEPKYRLGMLYDDLGQHAEALPWFEQAVAVAPNHNPTLLRLGRLYRRLDRNDDARTVFQKALANNPYDYTATLALSEMDIETGTVEGFRSAVDRLSRLLEWMPEHIGARVNLGVALHGLGRDDEAVAAYEEVLRRQSTETTASLNVAQIYRSRGDFASANRILDPIDPKSLTTVEQAAILAEIYSVQRHHARALLTWLRFLEGRPDSIDGVGHATWAAAMAGDTNMALLLADRVPEDHSERPLVSAARTYLALRSGETSSARDHATELCRTGKRGAAARQQLLHGLELYDEMNPNNPWTFYLCAQLLAADGRYEEAKVFAWLFEQFCKVDGCTVYRDSLRSHIEGASR